MPDFVLLIGRMLASAIFIEAGLSKLMNVPGAIAYLESVGVAMPSVTVWLIIALELGGGLAALIGFMARAAAVALAAFSVVAAAIGHSDFSNLMHFQAFMKDLAIAGGYLFIAVFGPGALSLDAWLAKRAA